MCGQFDALLGAVYEALLGPSPATTATRRVVPSLGAPILILEPETGKPGTLEARFGLMPHWYRGALRDWKATTFNARLETAAEKPVFKGAWRYRRAIVPAACFYEWSGPKNDRQRWRVTRADNQLLGMAALWDEALLTEGELFSFALLTRPAGVDMAPVHDREPCVLHPDQWEAWMSRRPVDLNAASPLKLSEAAKDQSASQKV